MRRGFSCLISGGILEEGIHFMTLLLFSCLISASCAIDHSLESGYDRICFVDWGGGVVDVMISGVGCGMCNLNADPMRKEGSRDGL